MSEMRYGIHRRRGRTWLVRPGCVCDMTLDGVLSPCAFHSRHSSGSKERERESRRYLRRAVSDYRRFQ